MQTATRSNSLAVVASVVAMLLAACGTPAGRSDSAGTAPNADVTAAAAAVSTQRIEARIRSLVGFGTRHTLSETDSETRGIGAARRWIARELQACSTATGGRLQVTFDEHLVAAGTRLPRATSVVNVVGTLPGTDPQARERLIVVSGHYDSRASDVMDATTDAPGANDDASGVAAVMEMACVMARYRYPATLVFIAVAGEEQGLLGAEQWAARAQRDGLRVEAMITNDIIGSPVGDRGQRDARQVRLFADALGPLLQAALSPPTPGAGQAEKAFADGLRSQVLAQVRAGGSADFGANQLGRHLKEAGERYVPGFTVNLIQRPDRYLRGGDHLPFLSRGFAAVRMTEPFENFAHQHQDVRTEAGMRYGDLPEFVDYAYVADVTRINLAGLATLALAPAAPRNAVIETLELSNDTALRWDPVPEAGLAGYRIVWRETGSPAWQHRQDVGNVLRATLPLSKDNLIFGVQALGADGNASMASFPLPLRR
jgi:hypothetical protein